MKKLINLTMFDLLKGVAMLCVLIGHSVVHGNGVLGEIWWGKILLSFLMPAFFMVSGYWLKKKAITVGMKDSLSYLLKPYILFILIINVVGFLHRALAGNLEEWVDTFLIPSVLVSTNPGSRIGAMWFVFALLLAWILYYIVINIKNEKTHIIIAILSAVLGGALLPLRLPFQIAQGLIAFFYLYCGYFLKKKKLFEKKLHPVIYIVMIIAWVVTIIYGSMDLYNHDVKYGIVSILGSFCGAFILIKLFLYLNLLEWRILDGIRWIGRYSMWFVCIHAIENAVFPWKILFKFVEQGTVLGTLVHFVSRLIFIIVACMVMQKFQMYRISRKKGGALC